MASEAAGPAADSRLHRLFAWFDPESAAVATILLGLFQVMLSVPLLHIDGTLPKLFILPLLLGIMIVAGGSLTMANERSPSTQLLRGCACSNVVGLVVALLAFFLYLYNLSTGQVDAQCPDSHSVYYTYSCPAQIMKAYGWSVTLLLLLYDAAAVVLHSLLSLSALKALKRG